MKKVFVILFLMMYHAVSIADIVYVGQAAGPRMTTCRTLFQMYDDIYGTKTTIISKPGVEGTIAIEKAIEDQTLICAGTDSVFTKYRMKPVLLYCYSPISFWTSTKNSAQSIDSMINKPIFVGYHLSNVLAILKKMYPNANITYVPYKTPNEGLPSILDGSLDVYVDGGGLVSMERAGKLKNIGKFGGSGTGPDLSGKYPEIAGIKNFCGVMAPESVPDAKIKLLHDRLAVIARTEEFSKLLATFNQTSYVPSLTEAEATINHVRKLNESIK